MKFEAPNIDPKKALGSLDELANKVPDSIAKLLKKIALALLVFFIIVAAYYGWILGYGENNTEGLQVAEDQKSLFREDIEREYNRKRKNINLSDIELDISNRAEERMLREEITKRTTGENLSERILSPSDKPLEDESSLYNQVKESPSPNPRLPNENKEFIPGKDESLTPILKRVDSLEKEIETGEDRTRRLEKMIDRLEDIDKKRELVRPQ